jgi:hypothetical protein
MSNMNNAIITQALERGLSPDEEPLSPIDSVETKREVTSTVLEVTSKIIKEDSSPPFQRSTSTLSSAENRNLDKEIAALPLSGNVVRNLNTDFFEAIDREEMVVINSRNPLPNSNDIPTSRRMVTVPFESSYEQDIPLNNSRNPLPNSNDIPHFSKNGNSSF